METILVARLDPNAILPTRKHPHDAGLDIYALRSVIIPAHQAAIVATGITLEIPQGMVGLLKPKGKNNHLVGSGVIDAGYQGEILVKVINPYAEALEIKPGEAIAQMLLLPVDTPAVLEVSPEAIHQQISSRGATGGIVDQAKSLT
ncbi:MAG TPA: hypothetical protein VHO48_04615 [Anaerolineaceae bacterium]|nr:hypothetical protein [Anaerolineaceae bacterium]